MTVVPTMINGRWELLLPDHRAARPEWPWWEAARLAAMNNLLRPGDVVYDVGAEEGDLPALWATWGCEVFLFEPNPKVWPNIRAVWEANKLPPPRGWFVGFAADEDVDPPNSDWWDASNGAAIEVVKAALATGATGGWPRCAYGDLIGNHGFLNLCERPDVARARIDTFAEFAPPTAITIDVEGAELAVLHGATRTLCEQRPIVWVSIHPEFSVDLYGKTREDVLTFMAGLGYESTFLATDHEEHWMFRHRTGR